MTIKYPQFNTKFWGLPVLEVRVDGQRKGSIAPGQTLEIDYPQGRVVTIKLGLLMKATLENPQKAQYTICNSWWLRNFSLMTNLISIVMIILVNILVPQTLHIWNALLVLIAVLVSWFLFVSTRKLQIAAG